MQNFDILTIWHWHSYSTVLFLFQCALIEQLLIPDDLHI